MAKNLLFFLCALSLLACKTNEKEDIIEQDNISFTDFEPDIIIAPTLYYVPETIANFYYVNVPVPTDTTVIYDLDLDNDNLGDMLFKVKRWAQEPAFGPPKVHPQSRYSNLNIWVEMVNNQNWWFSYHKNHSSWWWPTEFEIDQLIGDGSVGHTPPFSSVTIKTFNNDPNGWSTNPKNPEFYFGFRHLKNGSFHYGWILVEAVGYDLHIKEFAYNQTPNAGILTGQKK